jgi:hypothetical protein
LGTKGTFVEGVTEETKEEDGQGEEVTSIEAISTKQPCQDFVVVFYARCE